MTAALLDGRAIAQKIEAGFAAPLEVFKKAKGRSPALAVVTGPEHPSSKSYLDAKSKACGRWSITFSIHRLTQGLSAQKAQDEIAALGHDKTIDAITVVSPLPDGLDASSLYDALPPQKDVEGMGSFWYGRLFRAKRYSEIEARKLRPPCTASAIVRMLLETGVGLSGKRAVIVGRSALVGRPAAHLLSLLDLTVVVCHSKTESLKEEIERADVVVACAGHARLIAGDWIKRGAIVIDAGINYVNGGLCGDVDFEGARQRSRWITPVPGGVGPVTTATLLQRVLSSE